jgi:hypothetical protein
MGAKHDRRSSSDRGPAPLVAADVDEDPDQPGFFLRKTGWYRLQGCRRSQEGFLDEIFRVAVACSEPAGQPVQAIFMRLEQDCQPIVIESIWRRDDRHDGRKMSGHNLTDVRAAELFDAGGGRIALPNAPG